MKLAELLEKLDSLKYAEWYLASEWEKHNYDNVYSLKGVNKKEAVLGLKKYDKNVKDFVETLITVNINDVCLLPIYATNLEYEEGIYLLVSAMVREALPLRKDLVSPGQLLRDDDGNVIGCLGLVGNFNN